jgi:hypothetical protein
MNEIVYRRQLSGEFDLEGADGKSVASIRFLGGVRRRIAQWAPAPLYLPFVTVSMGLFLPSMRKPAMSLIRLRLRERALILDGEGHQRCMLRGVFTVRHRTFDITDPLNGGSLGLIHFEPEGLVLEDALARPFARVGQRPVSSMQRHPSEWLLTRVPRQSMPDRNEVTEARLAEASVRALPTMALIYRI